MEKIKPGISAVVSSELAGNLKRYTVEYVPLEAVRETQYHLNPAATFPQKIYPARLQANRKHCDNNDSRL